MRLWLSQFESPVGRLSFAVDDSGALCALGFDDPSARLRADYPGAALAARPGGEVAARLDAYFEGEVEALEGLPVAPRGTSFQRKVWHALRGIPAGETRSYADVARAVGRPRAVRAVGNANGRNPIALVLPCHRVIASDGTLGGYGGGLDRKRWLLGHEAARRPLSQFGP